MSPAPARGKGSDEPGSSSQQRQGFGGFLWFPAEIVLSKELLSVLIGCVTPATSRLVVLLLLAD